MRPSAPRRTDANRYQRIRSSQEAEFVRWNRPRPRRVRFVTALVPKLLLNCARTVVVRCRLRRQRRQRHIGPAVPVARSAVRPGDRVRAGFVL